MLKLLTAGESHGESLTAILEGMVSGLRINTRFVNTELAHRQKGYGRGDRQKIETDKVHITAGIRNGETIGSPIALTIKNRDFVINELEPVHRPRPGHGDLAGITKYDRTDARDILERASARETAVRVAAGAICMLFLKEFGIQMTSFTACLGGLRINMEGKTVAEIRKLKKDSLINCPCPMMESEIINLIDKAREEKDTLGGVIEVRVEGVPPGLGSHAHSERKLDARLAGALMGIQAIKGVETGLGFAAAMMRGSDVHEPITYDPGREGYKYTREGNSAGGIEAGISNGSTIVVRAAMKPISTLGSPIESVDIRTKEVVEASYQRSDITAVPAAGYVCEAVAAFVLADAFLEKFGGDSMREVRRNYDGYIDQISGL
jgi:chorismate synthase